MAPVSGGTAQSDVISMWHALRGTDYDLGIDIDKMRDAEAVFKDCMKDYYVPPELKEVEPLIPFSPMPGGALTANTQMMRDNNTMDRYPEILKAMSEAVEKSGYVKMVLGYFGKTPIAPDPAIVKLASEQLNMQPTTELPIDINDRNPKKGVSFAKKQLKQAGLPISDENIFITAACGDKGIQFLKGDATIGVRKFSAGKTKEEGNDYTVTINYKNYSVVLENGKAIVNGKAYKFDVKNGIDVTHAAASGKVSVEREDSKPVKSPLPGTVMRLNVKVGDHVTAGMPIVVIEAMKMETEIKASIAGPTGGYIISYIPAVFFSGLISRTKKM